MNVDRDSIQVLDYTLPWSFAGGAQYQLGWRATIDAQVKYTTWGQSNEEIQAAGGVGADNTFEGAIGAEIVTSRPRPGKFPIRVGLRTAQLPFPLAANQQASEFAVTAGTGARFAKGHAALDLALQRVWRSSAGDFSEDAWILGIGLIVKP